MCICIIPACQRFYLYRKNVMLNNEFKYYIQITKPHRILQMKAIFSASAPKAIGPYSHAIQTENLVYCSGQTPLDPNTMKIESTDIEGQTRRALQNLNSVLQAAGLSLSDVVKTNVFLTDMDLFPKMNAVYADVFGGHRPARSTVAVKGLPYNALVEIECIAEIKTQLQ
jgi:2-iminobutanoate/2-iminopropanoate deaminase